MQIVDITFNAPYAVLNQSFPLSMTIRNDDGFDYSHLQISITGTCKSTTPGASTQLNAAIIYRRDVNVADGEELSLSGIGSFSWITTTYHPLDRTHHIIGDAEAGASGSASGIHILYEAQGDSESAQDDLLLGSWASIRESKKFALLARVNSPKLLTASAVRNKGAVYTPENEGLNAWINATWSQSGDQILPLTLWYKHRFSREYVSSIDIPINGTDRSFSGVVYDGGVLKEFDQSRDFDFKLVLGDEFESTELALALPKCFACLALSSAEKGGACFGGFPRSTDDKPMLESHYPAYLYGGIEDGGFNYTLASGTEDDGESTEVPSGVWIDGSTIYRKSFFRTGIPSSSSYATVQLGTINGLKSVVDMKGIFKTTNWYIFPYYGSTSSRYTCNVTPEGVVNYSRYGSASSVIVTVYYTKEE